jgi:predicted nucleic acid-binding protein
VSRYLDASALVKLVLAERGTDVVEDLWVHTADVYVSLLGYTELRDAVAAAIRGDRVRASDAPALRARVEAIWGQVIGIDVDDRVVRAAGDLAERHRLRAADAIHLASAIRVRESDTAFVAFDARLREAAAAEGFVVLPETV